MKALLLPLDNRPVTYLYPRILAEVAGVEAVMPPRTLMGTLDQPAPVPDVIAWVEKTLAQKPDALILCLDTLLYGGLIPSRRSDEPLTEIRARAANIKRWKQAAGAPILAQASIMRLSDNYDNTEEKQYWSRYGREIFAWSEIMHRITRDREARQSTLAQAESRVPAEVREDYLKTRFRNYQATRTLVEMTAERLLDRLVLSQDDSGEFGLNVLEKERLIAQAAELNVTDRVVSYAGADEALCSLFAYWLSANATRMNGSSPRPRALVIYSPADAAKCFSRYEGKTIGESIENQIKAAGADPVFVQAEEDACDFVMLVHLPDDRQGDHITLPGLPDLSRVKTERAVSSTIAALEKAQKPVVLCDVAYANGADPALIEKLLERPELLQKLSGYAGWNTTGNSAGSAIATGIARWFQRLNRHTSDSTGERALKRALFTRLADDFAYQTQVRPQLTRAIPPVELAGLMAPHLTRIGHALGFQPGAVQVRQPWSRTFEVEVACQAAGVASD